MKENENDKLPEQGDIFMQADDTTVSESVEDATASESVVETSGMVDVEEEASAVEAQEKAVEKTTAKETKKSFEELLGRLETIVEKMENGGLKLEESMALYEEGVSKAETLTSLLADSRGRVLKLISETEGESKLETFDEEDEL